MKKSLGIKEFYSIFFFSDFIEHGGIEYMVLPSHIPNLDTTKCIPELARFLERPSF